MSKSTNELGNKVYKEVMVLRNLNRVDEKTGNVIVKFDVLKTIRPTVKITDKEAATLNGSVLSNENRTFSYYLKQDETEIPDLIIQIKK